MKKSIIFSAVITVVFFTSCKKNRTCTCTASTTSSGTQYSQGNDSNFNPIQVTTAYSTTTSGGTDVTTFNKISKKDGDQQCPATDVQTLPVNDTSTSSGIIIGQVGNSVQTINCTLK
jgi:hypothetical protein